MTDTALLGPWIRRYLLEHIVGERNLARNTQRSYRDTLRLLLPFAARCVGNPVDRLAVEELSADHLRSFLQELEEKRGCSVATRNQRLAAVHSLAHFIARHSPEHIRWCGEIRAVPFKKAPRPLVTLLISALVIRWGYASLSPMRVGAKNYEPVDVIEPEGLPLYSCAGCGTQLVLLRKGNDRAPRHCGEPMRYDVVTADEEL